MNNKCTILGLLLIFICFGFYFEFYYNKPHENYTNLNYNNENYIGICLLKKLLDSFNKNIKKQYTLNPNNIKNVNQYYSETIPPEVKNFSNLIIKKILCQINKYLKTDYRLLNYDTIIVKLDNTKKKLYLLDFFIYQTKYNIISKIIIEFIEFSPNILHINKINIANGLDDIIEEDLNQNNNIIIKPSNSNLSTNKNPGIESHYLSQFSHIKDINKTSGINIFPSSCNIYPSEINFNSISFNPWILSKKALEAKIVGSKPWPCGSISQEWDTLGINKNKPSLDNPLCRGGYNTATVNRNLIPIYQPGYLSGPPLNKTYVPY